MGHSGPRAPRPHHGGGDRSPPREQGVSGVSRRRGSAHRDLQSPDRPLQGSRRSDARDRPAEKRRTVQPLDYALALLSGALLALSFPKFGHPAFAWFALSPILVALVRPRAPNEQPLTARRAFILGLSSGAVYFAVTLYWLVETMTTFGGLQPALAAFAAAVAGRLPVAVSGVHSRSRLRGSTRAFGPEAFLLAAPAWVATELGRQYVWDGFPWALLGLQPDHVAPDRSARQHHRRVWAVAVAGADRRERGLCPGDARIASTDRGRGRSRLLVLAIGLWGQWRLHDSSLLTSGEPVRVAVLQANIAQDDKWNPALADAITDSYLDDVAPGARCRARRSSSGRNRRRRSTSSTTCCVAGAIRRLAREAQGDAS